MIDAEFMGMVMVLSLVTIIMLVAILIGNFWKQKPETKCSECGEEFTNCKIFMTDEDGTKIYCHPNCLEKGMKKEGDKK